MFLDKKNLLKIWLNPGLNLTIFRETGPRCPDNLNESHLDGWRVAYIAGVFWAGESCLFMFVTAIFDAMTEED